MSATEAEVDAEVEAMFESDEEVAPKKVSILELALAMVKEREERAADRKAKAEADRKAKAEEKWFDHVKVRSAPKHRKGRNEPRFDADGNWMGNPNSLGKSHNPDDEDPEAQVEWN